MNRDEERLTRLEGRREEEEKRGENKIRHGVDA